MSKKLDCDLAFIAAVMKLDEDARPFVEMLFAGHPKNEDEWLLLAAYLRGDLRKRPGRPADDAVTRAAKLYPKVRRNLHQFEQETGRRLRPHREAALACTLAYLREQGYAVPELKKLDNYLHRSKIRRSKKARIKR